jgi:hypothetical protein
MVNTIVNDEEANQWFFVYAAYSHRYNRVSYFVHFADRDEHFVLAAKHFYSNFYSILIGKDQWNNSFPGVMKKFAISFCEGAYRTDFFENLYKENLVASVGFDTKKEHPCCGHCATCETADNCRCITCAALRNSPELNCPCNDGYYENTAYECVACDYKCTTCETNADNCITCSGNRVNAPHCHCPVDTHDE